MSQIVRESAEHALCLAGLLVNGENRSEDVGDGTKMIQEWVDVGDDDTHPHPTRDAQQPSPPSLQHTSQPDRLATNDDHVKAPT